MIDAARRSWLVFWLAAAAPAHAQPASPAAVPTGTVRDGQHRYQLVVAPRWQPVTPPQGTLLAYQAPDGRAHLAVSRVNTGLRRARDAVSLAAEVERGAQKATPTYRNVLRKLAPSGRNATFDLWYERTDGGARQVIRQRYLFFLRHTVVLSIGLRADAERGERAAADAMLRSFEPFTP